MWTSILMAMKGWNFAEYMVGFELENNDNNMVSNPFAMLWDGGINHIIKDGGHITRNNFIGRAGKKFLYRINFFLA